MNKDWTPQNQWKKRNKSKVRAQVRRWRKKNKKWLREYGILWRKKNQKKINAKARLRRYDISQELHDALLKKQKNRCAICKKKFQETPHTDHDHKTGTNRGLLCSRCNLALGQLRDSILLLKNAIKYLKGFVSAHA